jgi:Sec-independent protein secretion pathway component TatC
MALPICLLFEIGMVFCRLFITDEDEEEAAAAATSLTPTAGPADTP